ncbi:MAG: hypothetical protein ABJE47_25390 [bacterium]
MRLPHAVSAAVLATILFGCGGTTTPATPPLGDEPPPGNPAPPGFPNISGTWTGTLNYQNCLEPAGLGLCAALHVPPSTQFQATFVQSPTTEVQGTLTVAKLTGTLTFDDHATNVSGIIDQVGSIFFDDGTVTIPLPSGRIGRNRPSTAQLDGATMFGNVRMDVSVAGGGPGAATVSYFFRESVRAVR